MLISRAHKLQAEALLKRGAALTPSEERFVGDVVRATTWTSAKRQRFDLLVRRILRGAA